MWAMSDRTLPRSLRMMEGFGIHSFRLINAAGDSTFVKFHWRPKLGLQSTLWDEAVKIAGADSDFHRRDMFESLQAGAFPEWEFAVQLFTEKEAEAFPFDHLDSTKLIPEELVPLKVVGRMVLDRWPDNFFAETEQVAFCPSHILPGMDFSNDPLLQGRLFSYLDTQLSRLGSHNFHQIPINAPKCPFANHQRDGHMQMQPQKGRVAYEPSSLAPDSLRESAAGFRSFPGSETGDRGRVRAASFADHYSQARMFYISQSPPEQDHIASALVFELSKVETVHIRERVVSHLLHIAGSLAQRVAAGLGMKDMPSPALAAATVQDMAASEALALMGKMKDTLEGRCVAFLVSDGSNAAVIAALQKAVLAEGARFKLIAPKVGGVQLSDGSHLAVDGQLAGSPSVMFDAVAVVLSGAGAKALFNDAPALEFVRDAFAHLKAMALDDGGEALFKKAGLNPDAAVLSAADVSGFVLAAKTRHWTRESTVRSLA
jgi:catalase